MLDRPLRELRWDRVPISRVFDDAWSRKVEEKRKIGKQDRKDKKIWHMLLTSIQEHRFLGDPSSDGKKCSPHGDRQRGEKIRRKLKQNP